jgi:hypothetical protein
MLAYTSLKLTDNAKVRFHKGHSNTFSIKRGLPKDGGSCLDATEGKGGCLQCCYAENLRKLYKNYAAVEDHNMALLQGLTESELRVVLNNTVTKWLLNGGGTKPYFRIHTSGDFYDVPYARAWSAVVAQHPEIKFWVYTRALWAIDHLMDNTNLTIMLSCDPVNKDAVMRAYKYYRTHKNIAVAWMGNTVPEELVDDRPMLRCPAITKATKGTKDMGACAKCRCCIDRTLKSGEIRHVQFPIHR